MKRITFLYLFIFGLLMFYIVNSDLNREQYSWRKTYSYKDNKPMGASVFFNLLKSRCPDMFVWNKTLYQLSDTNIHNAYIVMLQKYIDDTASLHKLEKKGNTFIIIQNYIHDLYNTFTIWNDNYPFEDDSLLIKKRLTLYPTFRTGLKRKYSYEVFVEANYFNRFDTSSSVVFLKDTLGLTYGIRCKNICGKPIYLISVPDIFCNYFIVHHPNRYLVYSLIDYMMQEKKTIVWYEYEPYSKKNSSLLSFIFSNKSIHTAWICLLITFLLYAFFDSRRNQKAVPVVHPPSNDTLDFIDVVANAHYKAENHSFIAKEIIHDFYEYIRHTYRMDFHQADDKQIQFLSALSGCSEDVLIRLQRLCHQMLDKQDVSAYELTEMEKLIQLFHSKNKPKK